MIKTKFKEFLGKKEFSILEIEDVDLISKEEYKEDLIALISCSENYFEDLLKVYGTKEKVLKIDSDKYLKIKGTGILYLIVNQNSNLFLDIDAYQFEGLFIKILVKENIKLNLINQNNGQNLFTNIKIIQEENSQVKHLVFNVNNKQNINESNLNKSAIYELEGINYSSESDLINFNNVFHKGNNSNSNFKINCYAFEKSIIMCKTKTKVESNAKSCIGHQKAYGLILSNDSKINCEPILEILSNDVISSHSASVSKIFDDTKYYLMSRGMSDEEIKDFIVKERFNYLIEKIEVEEFKHRINILD